jgi:LPXTG-motif cell wall-anchored protein
LIRKAFVVVAVLFGALMMTSTAGAQYQPGQPGLVLTPSTTTPGGSVTALGFGCPPGSVVEISIDGTVVGTTIAAHDGKGSFQVPFTAPTTPGQFTVTATCGVTIVSSILTVIAAPTTLPPVLPRTGSDSTLPLTRLGLVLVAGGGLLVLAVRKRREA